MHRQRLLLAWLIVGFALGCDKKSSGEQAGAQAKGGPERMVQQHEREWKVHTSEKCGYSVELPDGQNKSMSFPDIIDSVNWEGPGLALISMCMDVEGLDDPDEALRVFAETQKAEWPGATSEMDSIELQGWPGREIRLRVPADKKPPEIKWSGALDVRLRIHLVGTRVYMIQAMGSEAHRLEGSMERFLASFRPLEVPPPPPK